MGEEGGEDGGGSGGGGWMSVSKCKVSASTHEYVSAR